MERGWEPERGRDAVWKEVQQGCLSRCVSGSSVRRDFSQNSKLAHAKALRCCCSREETEPREWAGLRTQDETERDVWYLEWHEEDFGCDRKNHRQESICRGKDIIFGLRGSSRCWQEAGPGGCEARRFSPGQCQRQLKTVHTPACDG